MTSWLHAPSSPERLKQTIFAEMRKLGADYLEAGYSGGNDEGGINDVVLFCRAAPRKRKDVSAMQVGGKLVKMQRITLPKPGYLDYDHPLHEALDDLLSIDFGTWAGEFSAFGTVIADANAGTVSRSGEVSTYSYDDSSGEW